MNIALRKPRMTREEFLDWAEIQDIRYEFDGFQPVAMTGGNIRHSQITVNLQVALTSRLAGRPCRSLGPDAGVRTTGDAVRYPDAVVTCTKVEDLARVLPNPVVVFEVLSPTSGHVDRIVKLREYQAVGSIRRYIIVESRSMALTVHARAEAEDAWITTALTGDEILPLPEIGIEVPVAELFAGTELADGGAGDAETTSPGD
jgi:Uma2 family endonuclease